MNLTSVGVSAPPLIDDGKWCCRVGGRNLTEVKRERNDLGRPLRPPPCCTGFCAAKIRNVLVIEGNRPFMNFASIDSCSTPLLMFNGRLWRQSVRLWRASVHLWQAMFGVPSSLGSGGSGLGNTADTRRSGRALGGRLARGGRAWRSALPAPPAAKTSVNYMSLYRAIIN